MKTFRCGSMLVIMLKKDDILEIHTKVFMGKILQYLTFVSKESSQRGERM